MLTLTQTGEGHDGDSRRCRQWLECVKQGLAATPAAAGLLPKKPVLGANNQGGGLGSIIHAAIVRGPAHLRTFDLAQIANA